LKLIGVSLDDRGQYRCAITLVPSYKTQDSQTATLEVVLPDTTEQFDELEFSHEDVKILQQPILPFQNVKAAIGEKVHLTCLAGCKYGLKYEWLKRGVRTDLIGKGPFLYYVRVKGWVGGIAKYLLFLTEVGGWFWIKKKRSRDLVCSV
jgi:hypothetical protein